MKKEINSKFEKQIRQKIAIKQANSNQNEVQNTATDCVLAIVTTIATHKNVETATQWLHNFSKETFHHNQNKNPAILGTYEEMFALVNAVYKEFETEITDYKTATT